MYRTYACIANCTIARVPGARRGRPGTHGYSVHAPISVDSESATAPATSAQYPQPIHAKRSDTTTDMPRATMSFADTRVKRIARLRSARCWTDKHVKRIVNARTPATAVIFGSPYARARSGPSPAKA